MIMIEKYEPIFITGVERSGNSIIARILDMCGVWSGVCNNMFENKVITEFNREILSQHPISMPEIETLQIPINWRKAINGVLVAQHGIERHWMVKHSGLACLWPIWNYAYPNAKWLIIRRKTGDVVTSCVKTGYMKTFKDPVIRGEFLFETEEEGWLWWIHQYEERFRNMIEAGLNCRVIWPERMVTGDYTQIYETIQWLGLKWNPNIPKVIDPLLNKSREVKYENNY